ncbi:MAG TPA: phasin family protein [Dokdonella sp.]|uniref:phasin family protein n=1 Tax=Dokdonella sp. TaxID=2291710 RepID=UPI002D7F1C1D|nr:phasin family protein [Dokdonella sp.]HET9033927.1 phasin family protein [Dokdonella sp.]
MSKQIKVTQKNKAATMTTADKAQKVWLAGLGAFSIAQKQGIELFESMVSEGKSYQASSEKLVRKVSKDVKGIVDSRMKPVKQRIKAIRSDAEAKIEQGVGRAMSYVGIPSKADVDALIARVDKLSRQLRAAK